MPTLADIPVLPVDAAPEAVPTPAAAPEAPAAPAAALPTPFDAISAGKLPGLQVPPVEKGKLDPIQEFVVTNLHTLQANGIEYVDLPNDTTVIYNPEVVTTEAIQKAYKEGNLDALVPTSGAFQSFVDGQAAVADVAPTPIVPSSGPSAAGSTPPGVNRARLANVTPPGPGLRPNPVPQMLAKRAV